MEIPDRIHAPENDELVAFNIIEGSSHLLKNGVPVHFIHTPESAVLKIDFVFHAGLRNQFYAGQASATSSMLSEGTSAYNAKTLADSLDYYGAYFQAHTHVDDAQITLYCLPKFLPSCLEYIYAILTDSIFPDKELETYKTNAIQRFLVNEQRNSFIARRAFYSSVFGNQNPYGAPVNKVDYEDISRETVTDFYQANYLPGIKYILAAGQVDTGIFSALEQFLSQISPSPVPPRLLILPLENPENIFIENDFSVQSTIKIGRRMFSRKTADFRRFQVLNMTLGGYFGSRLMKNIREEKGLTYGIHSAIESHWDSGAFYIETEINNELREKGKEEIFLEIKKLREENLPEQELKLVKNYLLGSFLRSIDGPFALADRYKMLLDYGFGYEYYREFVDIIKNISAMEIRELANRYLQEKDLTCVIVGKK